MRFKNETHAWVMWCMNYIEPRVWMNEIWGGTLLYDHFMGKFGHLYNVEGSSAVMNCFFCELSDGHKEELRDWVMNNYAQDNWNEICLSLKEKYYPSTK